MVGRHVCYQARYHQPEPCQPLLPQRSVRANTINSYLIVPSMKQWRAKSIQIWDVGMRNQGIPHGFVLNGYRKGTFQATCKEIRLGGQ